jgi:carbamoyl-phosphate synthase large subunit
VGYYGKNQMRADEIVAYIKVPKWDRVFRIKDALMMGVTVKTIAQATGIDRWFLYQIQHIVDLEKTIAAYSIDTIPADLLLEAKTNGFSDEQLARIMKNSATEDAVYEKRKALGITRVYKMVDTCSAEFAAKTPYFYSTFEGVQEKK